MVASFVLVNVQVTFSPAAAMNVAIPLVVLPVLSLSSQTILVNFQPAGTVSAEVNVPGCTLVLTVPLLVEIVPPGVPVKVKVPVPPSMTFLIVMVASLVLVNVHVTFSPAATMNVAMPLVVLPVLSLSSHVMLVSFQPAGTVSAEVKVPG